MFTLMAALESTHESESVVFRYLFSFVLNQKTAVKMKHSWESHGQLFFPRKPIGERLQVHPVQATLPKPESLASSARREKTNSSSFPSPSLLFSEFTLHTSFH